MKILLLEDDKNLHISLKEYLQMEGFEVISCYNSDDIYNFTYNNSCDLYILDVNVQGDNGFEILNFLREADDNTPAIYITALTDINSINSGFQAGAYDYIKKPFDPEELVIRIKNRFNINNNIIIYNDLVYNPISKELLKNSKPIVLGQVLNNIFHQLIIQKNKVVPIDILYNILKHPSPNALRVNINKLKNRLDLNIKNIRQIGYMLEEV